MTLSADGPPALHVRTVEVDDPGSLVQWLPVTDAHAWIRRGDGMVAFGEVVRHKATTIADARDWWADLTRDVVVDAELDSPVPGSGLLAFGAFLFDPNNSTEQSTLIVPETIIGRRNGRSWITRVGLEPDANVDLDPTPPAVPPRNVTYADGALTGPEWEAAVAEAVQRINTNGLDKVVLARDLLAFSADPIDPRWLVQRLATEYGNCWTYLVDGLIGASPEMLVRREEGLATSRVLAGTIRRSGHDEQDLALAAALSQSSKDLEEHEYAVRSVAKALSPYCSGMNVPDAPYVLELPNVLHLATDVTAAADADADSLTLAAALHPSAAVCGTPTDVARATIAELEQLDRERYAGPVGWVDSNGDGEWAIALRCGQLSAADPREIRLFAGCGIVAGSDPAAELAESNAKLVPMRDALGV